MPSRIRRFAAVVAGTAAVLASIASVACPITPPDPVRLKQIMAREIAHRLGMHPQQVPLNVITAPQLHSPVAVGRDCRGIEHWHHSAAFRIVVPAGHPAPSGEPMRWPEYPREEMAPALSKKRQSSTARGGAGAPGRWTRESGWPGRWPVYSHCAYEGVAAVLGYADTSPVAVNFERQCW
ncbi:hypothetical protein D3C78_1195490 [compost metagenome]